MFEGAIREGETLPAGWWLLWVGIACGLALLRTLHPDGLRHAQWAWTNWRLLFQVKGDSTGLTFVDGLTHVLAGLVLSLSVSSMWSMAYEGVFEWRQFWRMWLLWLLLMGIRWCTCQLMVMVSGSVVAGREWGLSHRMVLESTFWLIGPLGIATTFKGPEAAKTGLVVALVIWLASWVLRQRRAAIQLVIFERNRLMAILYLCALEILPVAVLLRAWQG